MKKLLFIATFSFFVVNASIASTGSVAWTASPFDQKVFIENISQFDGRTEATQEKILFGTSVDGVELYFTNTGIKYRHIEAVPMTEEERDGVERNGPAKMEREGRAMMKSKTDYLSIEWAGANPETNIITQDSVSFYYTYAAEPETITAHAFKKIIYQNLYPNIDVEYIFPEGKKGIKYSLIIHPGADVSQIKMRYTGAENLSRDDAGNVIIKSLIGDFVDHAPVTTAGKLEIPSSFILNGNEVSFKVNAYDHSHELVIDPWTTNPNFLIYNAAYDVNYDLKGNVYTYGSYGPFKLAKFNSTGVVQWIFNATTLGQWWSSDSSYLVYGDFAVDEVSSTSYLVEGGRFVGARVFKVNTLGIRTATFPGVINIDEMWRAEYVRSINKILIAGGGIVDGSYHAALLDTNMVITLINVLSDTAPYHDMTLLTVDNNSEFCYMATAQSTNEDKYNNILIKCPIPNLLPRKFSVSDGHRFGEVASIAYIRDGMGRNKLYSEKFANGMNGMVVSPCWLYTYDSDSLKRWDKGSGAFNSGIHVSSNLLPMFDVGEGLIIAAIQVPWGGLTTDLCDNIYVGVMDSIKEYNTSLSLINSFRLPDTVYDVKLGPNNKLYACGRGFVTQIDYSSCHLPKLALTIQNLDIGTLLCDTSKTMIVVAKNVGYSSLIISSASGLTGSPFTVVSPTFPDTIKSGDSIQLLLEFASSIPGTYSRTLFLATNEGSVCSVPPIDSLQITARKELAAISRKPASYNFGDVTCENYETTVTITNVGTVDVQVTDSAFTQAGLAVVSPTLPVTIRPGSTKQFTIHLDASKVPVGSYASTLELKAQPCDLSAKFQFTANRKALVYTVSPPVTDFGITNINKVSSGSVVFDNQSDLAVRIRSAQFDNTLFTVTTSFPQTVAPHSTFGIDFTCYPSDTLKYESTLTIKIDSPCADDRTALVRVEGASVCPQAQSSEIIGATPGEYAWIPIIVDPSTKLTSTQKIEATVKWDKELLRYAGDVVPTIGTLSNPPQLLADGGISFTITTNGLPSPIAEIARIKVQSLLAPYGDGKIDVSTSTFTLQNGEKIAGLSCPVGFTLGEDCIKRDGLRKKSTAIIEGIYPNPSNSSARVVIKADGSPEIKLEVYDRYGRKIETLADGKLPNEKNELVINTSTYSNGIYFCRMTHGGKIITREFNVQR